MQKFPTLGERIYASAAPLVGLIAPSAKAATASNTAPASLPQPTSVVDFDFDNDGKADVGRWHWASTEFRVKNSNGGSYSDFILGCHPSTTTGCTQPTIAPGDFNGDGKTDAALFTAGTWTYKTSVSATAQTISFGTAGDIPVAGDYDGDGTTDAAVYRPSTNTWWIQNSSGGATSTTFGSPGDIVVPGDYDGDGKNDLALYRPSGGDWHITKSSTADYYVFHWGISSDTPVPADFDGDGKTDPAVFRQSTGTWYVYRSGLSDGSFYTYSWGNYKDQPVPADYDGDGKADVAIWRPTTGVWYILKSSDSNAEYHTLGVPGDAAVPSAYLKQVGGAVSGDDLAAARLAPKNLTGDTDLYSQNFSWSRTMFSLPGRSGLDASLGLSYNSLVWTKVGSTMVFDADYSNASPGFRLGFPEIEPVHYDSAKNVWAYLLVTPSGGRVQFRQTVVTNVYETADSSYAQLVVTGATSPNSPVENITIKVTTTDGTQMSYSWLLGAYRCTQIKDRNGNYITIGYNPAAQLETITDTLGHIVTIHRDSSTGFPTSITQTWNDGNGGGTGTPTHTYASFTYATEEVTTNFGSLSVAGPPNQMNVTVLDKITYADESYTKFSYNGYVQVENVENFAKDDHSLNYIRTNLGQVSGTYSDCPRFSETYTKVDNFNLDQYGEEQEIKVTNTLTTGQTYSLQGGTLTGNAARIEVKMIGHPDGLYSNTYVGESGWKEGLTLATEDCTGTACADRKRWTWSEWTQDNESLTYQLNPRVKETRVGDATNVKKSQTDYRIVNGTTTVAEYGLASEVRVYDTSSNVIKKVTTDYNLGSAYASRRIIGLPSVVEAWGKNDLSGLLEKVSKVTYAYDEGNFSQESNQIITATKHDSMSYGSTFITGRGNLTSTTRHDVIGTTAASVSKVRYDIAGSPVAQLDPLDRKTAISYTDNFNRAVTPATFAYATTITDPAGNSSTIQYRYDIGANVEADSPAPDGNAYGKRTTRTFDTKGRLDEDIVWRYTTAGSWVKDSYKRYAYPDNGIQQQVYSTVTDMNANNQADAADEILTESWTDGAGRMRLSRVPHKWDTSGNITSWAGTQTEYDILGRVKRQSVPTEVNSSWGATGDDATVRWTYQKYDWMNRVVRRINTDGDDTAPPAYNDSDILISYEGCGCAGATTTTVESEKVPVPGTSSFARRKQKTYTDILGRTFKAETFDWEGDLYTSVAHKFNGRDQVVESTQTDETSTENPKRSQLTTVTFDGHGRLKTSHKPEQRDTSDNLKYTTYNYNADDTVADVTDGRGVVTAYTYNSRRLPTNIAWTVPSGSNIPDPTDVVFGYDNAANRISMSDGMGTVDYDYNSLSQLTAETRDFFDTLTDAPNGVFKLQYEYNPGGHLKSYTDPYDDKIYYTQDRIGRMTSVNGTSYAGFTRYANNPEYRAWGALKQIDYENGLRMNATYNSRLQPATFKIEHPTDTSKKVFSKEYDYYKDGQLKFVKENLEQTYKKFDRLYSYDHQVRILEAKSGTEATGTTQTNLQLLPYRQSYTHNAFGQMTSRESTLWTEEDWSFFDSYQNNRRTAWGYDSEGNILSDGDVTNKYDARSLLVETGRAVSFEMTLGVDGTGREVKRSRRKWNSQTSGWDAPETNYFIHSSVTGQTITEADGTGKKKRTFVISSGSVIARQFFDAQQNEAVSWEYTDASGQSIRGAGAVGTAAGSDVGSAEMDALGNNVGIHGTLQDPRNSDGDASPSTRSPISSEVMCSRGGIVGSCRLLEVVHHGSSFFSHDPQLPFLAGPIPDSPSQNPMSTAHEILQQNNPLPSGPWAVQILRDILRERRPPPLSHFFLHYEAAVFSRLVGDLSPPGVGDDKTIEDFVKRWARDALNDPTNNCAKALKNAKLLQPVIDKLENTVFVSVRAKGHEPASNYGFPAQKGESLDTFFRRRSSNATDINRAAVSNQSGIFTMEGASTFLVQKGVEDGSWVKVGFFLHELTHHATGLTDTQMAEALLGLPLEAGEDPSAKLNEFFNSNCDPVLGKPPPLPIRK